jgi:hypothetical protein
MAEKKKGCGQAGFNPNGTQVHEGAAGAYCCSSVAQPPCPTCYYANSALPVVKQGIECYRSLGVPASKLVLAFPWCEYIHHRLAAQLLSVHRESVKCPFSYYMYTVCPSVSVRCASRWLRL